MSKDALVIGGSIAGLQAALDLADAGLKVHLIESSPFFDDGSASDLPRHLLHVRQLEVAQAPEHHRQDEYPACLKCEGEQTISRLSCASILVISI